MLEKQVYTVKDIMKLLPMSKNTVYQTVHRSDFPKKRVGNKLLIPRDAFEKWLNDFNDGG